MPKRCIVIGASAGGFAVLKDLVSQLPEDLSSPVFVVMHVPAYHPSMLPQILSTAGPLPALHPEDGMKIEAGYIYVAPPDHHLLIDNGLVAVKRGPKENGFRPSIDALFRSAAYTFGSGVIGVVLSGALHDGASGLWSINRLGGTAIVQDPDEAEIPSMPRSALEHVEADYTVRAGELSTLITRLASEQTSQEIMSKKNPDRDIEERIAKEVNIAAGTDVSHKTILDFGELTTFTCPSCQGVLVKIKEGRLLRFRCHTGHGFSEDALLSEITQTAEENIWQVVRGLQETEMLLEHIGQHIGDVGEFKRAEKFFAKAREIGKRANQFHELAMKQENLSKGKLDEQESID